MIEFVIGAGAGVALTLAFTKFNKGSGSLATRMETMEMAVTQAFQDVVTNIEALPAKLSVVVQEKLDAANAQIAQLEQDGADNLAAVQDAVSKVSP